MSLANQFMTAIAPGALAWNPYFLANKQLWLDAEQQNTLSLNGSGEVTAWDDLSSNGYQMTPLSSAPTTITYNSKNWVNFSDITDGLKSTAVSIPAPFSIAMVVRLTVNGATNCHYFDGYNNFNERVFFRSGATTFQLASRNIDEGDGFGVENISSSWQVNLNPHIVVVEDGNNVTNGSFMYANGSLVVQGTLGAEGFDGLMLGQWINHAGNPLSLRGYMGEVVIVSGSMTTPDRQKLEGYLAHKWGTTSYLPTNHPYKTNAPTY